MIERLIAITEALGKAPAVLRWPVPGYLLNRLQYALMREAWNLVESGVCDFADVDRALTHGLGMRWAAIGPFEVQDVAGLDVHLAVAESLMPVLGGPAGASGRAAGDGGEGRQGNVDGQGTARRLRRGPRRRVAGPPGAGDASGEGRPRVAGVELFTMLRARPRANPRQSVTLWPFRARHQNGLRDGPSPIAGPEDAPRTRRRCRERYEHVTKQTSNVRFATACQIGHRGLEARRVRAAPGRVCDRPSRGCEMEYSVLGGSLVRRVQRLR